MSGSSIWIRSALGLLVLWLLAVILYQTYKPLDPLRDSTPIYSSVWRTFVQWLGQSGTGWLPNLMADQGPKITLRSYVDILNVKANQRKLVVSEQTALVSSGNVHEFRIQKIVGFTTF